MLGLAIGDALGASVEFRPNSYLTANPVKDPVGGGTWGLKRGQFTDDTSMAVCLANSLIACGGFIPYDQLVHYKWWFRHGYISSTGHCFDIGAATRQSIQEFEQRQRKFAHDHNIPLDKIDSLSDPELLQAFDVNCSKDDVAGNGALMRVAPVPLFFYRHPQVATKYSGISGKITHGDVKSYDACRYYGALIVAALNGAKKRELTSKTFYEDHRKWFDNQDLHPDIMAIAHGSYQKPGSYQDGIREKRHIVNALEAALWVFWSDEDSFRTGVLHAVNLGDDTDTTAAIYDQLAGAYYGYKKLPKKWLKCICAKNFLRCVSSWIAHEGEQWSRNQPISESSELIDSSDFVSYSSNLRASSLSTQQLYASFKLSLDSDMISSVILRKAIDSSGSIGHLYNAWQDQLLPSPYITLDVKKDCSSPLIKCLVHSGDKVENRNILRLINFSADLRLSVLSNLVEPAGIASVVDYPFIVDDCTRIFYYSYLVRNQALLHKRTIQSKELKAPATHVIIAIDQGIHVVILLKLPVHDIKVID
ncbi:unnamed protein product [Rotaria sp. Silwood2]|nr:unnamed protein product [Rotaria sp. Silwood2]CAF4203652.1 unnamed protein product [Rotaria sp. Silwood2]